MKKYLIAVIMMAVATVTVICFASFDNTTDRQSSSEPYYEIYSDDSGDIRYDNLYDFNISCYVEYKEYHNPGDLRNPTWEYKGSHRRNVTLIANRRNSSILNSGMREKYEVTDYGQVN